MIPIHSFCWHEFHPVQISNCTVGSLNDIVTNRNSPELFVFHDPVERNVFLVIPEVIISSVTGLHIPMQENLKFTGLLDVLRQGQMMVHKDQPASQVIQLAVHTGIHVIIAVDDFTNPVGLFFPSLAVQRLPQTGLFQSAFIQFNSLSDLPTAIMAFEASNADFHSERMNLAAPDPFVCSSGGRSHTVSSCPCNVHPKGQCGRRKVSS